jgi:hypothetical protein
VGQLAVDLLISSSRAKRVAYLDEPSVLPCAGNDAFGPDAVGDLALALEGWVLDYSWLPCAVPTVCLMNCVTGVALLLVLSVLVLSAYQVFDEMF